MHVLQERLLEQIEKDPSLGALPLRKIGERVGDTSPQKIKHHLSQLERNGFISIDPKTRDVRIVRRGKLEESPSIIAVPILGFADCGPATQIAEQRPEGFLKVSSKLLPKTEGIFALQAVGNSLNKAKIGTEQRSLEEGDYAIIDSKDLSPKNGDYVLSIIDGMANLKKFHFDHENNQVVLIAESSQDYLPIFIHPNDDYLIGGKVLSVLKNQK